ncbi:MAG: NfeD family protein [Oscillospiraceae bacterium]
MVCVWFAAGALAAFIISLFGGSLVWQLASFVIVSILLLILTRPIIKKSTHKEISHTNADSIIGEKGIVYEAIDNSLNIGRIRVCGMEYAAKSKNNELLAINTPCRVDSIVGVTAIVIAD